MDKPLAPVTHVLETSAELYLKALDGLDRETLLRRPDGSVNPMLWMAGHVAGGRCGMLTLAGGQVEFPWPELFGRGARPSDWNTLPDASEVTALFRETSSRLATQLATLTGEQLGAESPRKLPIGDRSVGGAITFLAYHEGYHIGQMSLLRRWLGLRGLADG
jgi:hypothetical protein